MDARVSIVISTYNRSDVLGYAIKSALAQTCRDIEVVVVGDACTDDTEAVVAGFDDDRLRFVNREFNHGEQSAPNNDGVGLTTGEWVAFLNHDDLWFPDHLEHAIEELERGRWDGTFSAAARLAGQAWAYQGPVDRGEVPSHRNFPCSSWLIRRATFEKVGVFRDARELRQAPSAEWIERARRLGCRFGGVPRVSLLIVPSGNWEGSYATREDPRHQKAYEFVASARGRENLLDDLVRDLARFREGPRFKEIASLAYRVCIAPVLHRMFGLTLGSQLAALRNPRKGSYLNRLRRVRGLSPLPPVRKQVVDER